MTRSCAEVVAFAYELGLLLETITRGCLPQCLLTQRVSPRLTELRAPECPRHFLRILTRLLGMLFYITTPLPDSTPPTYHTEESEDSDTSDARSTSSNSTAPLSPDHPLTRTSPTPTPTRASFHRRTACMTVHAQTVMSPGHSARVTKAMALSDSALRKRYRSSYETSSSSSSPALPAQKRYRGMFEIILDTDSKEEEIGGEDTDDDEGHGLDDKGHGLDDEGHGLDDKDRSVKSDGLELGYGALRHRELAVENDQVYSTFEVGQGYGSVLEPERPERVSTLRQPTLTTWKDPEDDIAYIDIPAYPPAVPPAQTPPSPEWSFGSLPISPTPFVVPLPISSPMISSTVSSPTLIATISVDEDQFIEIGAQLELFRGTLQDHTQRLDAMPPTLFAGIDRDVRELYTRSGVVRDEIFSQRPVLALEAWAGHVDTQMTDMSWAGYDDHRLVHDIVLDAMSRSGSYSNAQLEPWESEETPLEGTNLLEGQCIELGNGTSLLMIMVEKFELNFRGEGKKIPLRG
ncbi:hypothetical protein Tco_0385014, partial [Tanacetum coccineum]